MVNSRNKGAVGERELAELLREEGWPGAMRGQQRSGLEQADVVGGPEGWLIECKRTQALNVWRVYAEACADAAAAAERGDRPVEPLVAARRNKGPWLAILDLRVLLRLIAKVEALEAAERLLG